MSGTLRSWRYPHVGTRAHQGALHRGWSHRFGQPIGCGPANVTSGARGPLRNLAKMRTNLAVAALARFRKGPNRVISLPRSVALGRVHNLIGKICQQTRVLLSPKQNAVGWISIAPGASCLLIKLLH